MIRSSLALIGMTAFGFTSNSIFACSCVGNLTTCEAMTSAKVVFIGTVMQGSEPNDGRERRGFGTSSAVMRVETILRGLTKSDLEIKVNPSVGSSCYFPLRAGERWLIVGGGDGREVGTGGCSGSRLIPASDDMVQRMMDSFLVGPSLLLGEVRSYRGWDTRWRTDNLMSGVEVSLNRDGKDWSIHTDKSGRFEFQGLPEGEYSLLVRAPGLSFERPEDTIGSLLSYGFPSRVVVPGSGCVEAPLVMFPEQGIKGVVRGVDGKPVPGIRVSAYEIRENGELARISMRTGTTDQEGKYALQRMPNGTYVVGVNADWATDKGPYRMKFYPSADSARTASRLVMEGKTRDNIDIALDAPRKLVDVTVRVVFPDGKPVGNALITVERDDKGFLWSDARDPSAHFTNSAGLLKMPLYDGDQYILSATSTQYEAGVVPLREKVTAKSDSVRVVAGDGAVAKIVMNNPVLRDDPAARH